MEVKVKCKQLDTVVRQFNDLLRREREAREIVEIIFLLAEKVE